ncbi:hypothetical protein LCGC14_2487050, partial [marine sediment metagenome]
MPPRKPRVDRAPDRGMKRKARADGFLLIYLAMRSGRSLNGVSEFAHSIGSPVSKATLRRYSIDFGWVDAAKAFDAEIAQRQQNIAIDDALVTNARHVEAGKVLQKVGLTGAQVLLAGEGPDQTGSHVARLVTDGVKIERVAAGLATERIAVVETIWDRFLPQVVALFREATEKSVAVMFEWLAEVPELEGQLDQMRDEMWNASAEVFGPGVD